MRPGTYYIGVSSDSSATGSYTIHAQFAAPVQVVSESGTGGGDGGGTVQPVKMYWVEEWREKIQRANLDGSQVEDLITTGLGNPYGLALDVAGGKMYWTDFGTGKIQRANLDGTQREDLITTGGNLTSIALALGY